MTRAKKTRRSFKRAIALLLAGVMLVGQAHGIGAAGASTVQAAEETGTTVITSIDVYDGANGPTITKSGVSDVSYGFVMPKFNGLPSQELSLADVEGDLELQVEVDGVWTNIDNVEYFQWNSTWGWEYQASWDGWICWFILDETTKLRFHGITNDVNLEYNLVLNQLPLLEVESIGCSVSEVTADATGGSAIDWTKFTINGQKMSNIDGIQYAQIEDDFEILVDNYDGKGFVPFLGNAESGFIWDNNFGIYSDGNGGVWFKAVDWSFTLRFRKKDSETIYKDVKFIYKEVDRTNADNTLTPFEGTTTFDANAGDDNSGAVGIVLPNIGGTPTVKSDLEKYVYQVKINGEWIDIAAGESGWQYQGDGYSKYTISSQWGYFVDSVYGLWFQPVLEDTDLRFGFPENGVAGGDINDNWVEYHIIGDPDATVPDPADFAPIEVDNNGIPTGDVTNPYVPDGWNLIWNDEFNGTSVDNSKWANQTGFLLDPNDYTTAGWGNNELEHYTDSPENTSVANGTVKFTMLKDPKTFTDTQGRTAEALYSSGKLISQDKFSFKYGRVDFRAKFPAGTGIWPAVWMMPNDDIYGTWASSGEIDVFEGKGRLPELAYSTLHYGSQWPGNLNTGDKMNMNQVLGSDITDWHVYSTVWEEGEIKSYVDGICYFKRTAESWHSAAAPANDNAPFDQRFFLIMNLAAGGWFDGNTKPDFDSFTSAEMYVDYVRVYQAPVGDDEDEKPDSVEYEQSGKVEFASIGKDDNLYGDYCVGVQVPLEKMTLDKTSISIPAGVAEVITPSFEPENATNKNITWTSSNEAVATVSGGIVKGIAPGTATITAVSQDGNITKTCAVTVTGDEVVMIVVNPETLELEAGKKSKLTATVSTELSNQNVIWSSSNTSVATVDQNGNVTAVAEGTATITAQTEGGTIYSDTCEVTVTPKAPVSVTGVTIKNGTDESGEVSIEAGSSVTLSATVAPSDATNKNVTWTTGDDSIATVSNGKVTAVKEGTTTVTVKTEDGNYTDTWNVIVTKKSAERTDYGVVRNGNDITFYYKGSAAVAFSTMLDSADQTIDETQVPGYGPVQNGDYYEYTIVDGALGNEDKYLAYWFNVTYMDKKIIKVSDIPVADDGSETTVAVTGVTLNNTTLTMVKDETVTLRATVEPLTATNRNVTWKSSDDSIVSVDGGKLTALKAGTATITVTTEDGNKTATCTVTVTEESTQEPSTQEPSTQEPSTQEPSTQEPSTQEPSTQEPSTQEPSTQEPSTQEPSTQEPSTQEPSTQEPSTQEPSTQEPSTQEPSTQEPSTQEPSTQEPSTQEPGTETPVKVTGVSLNKTSISLQKGASETLVPTISPATATDTSVSWSSSDPTVVTVVNGVVTAVRKGTATITVTTNDGAYTATCVVTVTDTQDIPTNVPVTDIVISDVSKTIKVGESVTLTATAYPEIATNREITWSTLDSSVATVDSSTGLVTGVSAGTTDIYAIAVDGSGVKEVCTVTVQAENSTPSKPDTPSNPETKTYTVVFDSTGGSAVTSQVVTEGGMVTQPAVPTRIGYTFAGWYNGSAQYVFGTAVTGNLTLTAAWTVNKVNSINITGISKKIAANKKIQLTATVNEDALDKSVTWSVDKSKYATVSQSGVVKMKKAGKGKTVTVTATANDGSGVKATYKIKIMHYAVKKITLVGSKSVKAGKKVKLKAIVDPLTVSKKKINKTLQWTSSNEEWATVTKKGVVKTTKAGKGKTVKITAKATDGSNKKKTISIRIK